MRSHSFGPNGGRIVPICETCGKYKDSIKAPETVCATCLGVKARKRMYRSIGDYPTVKEAMEIEKLQFFEEEKVRKEQEVLAALARLPDHPGPTKSAQTYERILDDYGIVFLVLFWIAISAVLI